MFEARRPALHCFPARELGKNAVLLSVLEFDQGIGIGLAVAKEQQLRPFLIASIVASVLFWYISQAFGMILTGMATDFNSGLLLVVLALAIWPKVSALRTARAQVTKDLRQMQADETARKA